MLDRQAVADRRRLPARLGLRRGGFRASQLGLQHPQPVFHCISLLQQNPRLQHPAGSLQRFGILVDFLQPANGMKVQRSQGLEVGVPGRLIGSAHFLLLLNGDGEKNSATNGPLTSLSTPGADAVNGHPRKSLIFS